MVKSFRLNTSNICTVFQSTPLILCLCTSWNINQVVNVLKLLFPLSRRTVQKHWQCEMKQIMNAEVTSLHLASRAMVPTVRSSCSWLLCPTTHSIKYSKYRMLMQQMQDANTANAGCKYSKCRMQIQNADTANTLLFYNVWFLYYRYSWGTFDVPWTRTTENF